MMTRDLILAQISAHRAEQDAKHGPQYGLPVVRAGAFYLESEEYLKDRYERRKRADVVSHADIILEELAEALEAPDAASMRLELIQTAACCVKAIEALDWQRANEGWIDVADVDAIREMKAHPDDEWQWLLPGETTWRRTSTCPFSAAAEVRYRRRPRG